MTWVLPKKELQLYEVVRCDPFGRGRRYYWA